MVNDERNPPELLQALSQINDASEVIRLYIRARTGYPIHPNDVLPDTCLADLSDLDFYIGRFNADKAIQQALNSNDEPGE